MASTARRAATSPALWPPMPSAITQSPSASSIAKQSSLMSRTRPLSVTPNAASTMSTDYRLASSELLVEGSQVELRVLDLQRFEDRTAGDAVDEITGVFRH